MGYMGPKAQSRIRTPYPVGGCRDPTRILDEDWAYLRNMSVVIFFSPVLHHSYMLCHSRGRYKTPDSKSSKLLYYKKRRHYHYVGLCYYNRV